jgi:hypothetical protein
MIPQLLIATLALGAFSINASAADVSSALKTQQKSQKQGIKSQNKIDSLDDQTSSMLHEYREINAKLEEMQAYNDQLQREVKDQEAEIVRLDTERLEIEQTRRHLVPMMLDMRDVFTKFVDLDTPFLPDERKMRVEQLQKVMDRSDVPLAEKFRRLIEAYRVEAEYGYSIESYRGELVTDKTRTVDFLRLGRVGLYYLTLDGKESGFYNPKSQNWQILTSEFNEPIKDGLLMARKQLPPNLLILPFTSPEVAK